MLMLIKHLVIVVMIGLGFWFNALQRVGPAMRSNSGAAQGVAKFRQYSNLMAICGVIVLALTAFSQVQ
jgi:putative copper export protein